LFGAFEEKPETEIAKSNKRDHINKESISNIIEKP